MNFQKDDFLVMKNIEDQSKSIWRVVAVFTEAVEVVPLKDGKELKMLQGVYGSVRFRKAEAHEIKSGSRDFNFKKVS